MMISKEGKEIAVGDTVFVRIGGEYPIGRYRVRTLRVASIRPRRKQSLRLEALRPGKTGCWRSAHECYVDGNRARRAP
jgi:hypothetical protein